MRPREALQAALEAIRGEPLVILISGNPDPDAIACAFVHQAFREGRIPDPPRDARGVR